MRSEWDRNSDRINSLVQSQETKKTTTNWFCMTRPTYWAPALLLLVLALGSTAFASVPIVPAGQSFTCTPTHVWDGDGPIWCKEGPRIRLAGIAARELDESCKSNHPCPEAGGKAARDALVRLLGTRTGEGKHRHILVEGPAMRCRSDGSAGGNRTAAWCFSPKSGDINCRMVHGGWALPWDHYWRDHTCP